MSKFLYPLIYIVFIASAVPVKAQVNTGDQAPAFTIEMLNKQPFSLTEFKGKKAVYLVFWATWCSICQAEIPHLKSLQTQYKDKIKVLAINTGIDDTFSKAKRYKTKHALNYDVAFDAGSTLTKRYGVFGTPTQIIIDINGIVRYRGARFPQDLNLHLDRLLTKSH